MDKGIFVAVVTFSAQVSLITEFLRLQFPRHFSRIVIRGRDGSWGYKGPGVLDGKQPFMASAAMELMKSSGSLITKRTTILVDDDLSNIKFATRNGVIGIPLFPDNVSR